MALSKMPRKSVKTVAKKVARPYKRTKTKQTPYTYTGAVGKIQPGETYGVHEA